MFESIQNLVLFCLSAFFLFFLPGLALLLTIPKTRTRLSLIEKSIISFPVGLVAVDFITILIAKLGININRPNIILVVAAFILLCLAIYFFTKDRTKNEKTFELNFGKREAGIFLLLIFLTIFIKTAYLKEAVFPTATDLGHHNYWIKIIVDTGKLPVYEERDIIGTNGDYSISEPEPIADFIIGEHLPLANLQLVSGLDFFSPSPVIFLFLINVLAALAIFILSYRIFESKNTALIAFLLIGPLWAISGSQVKYASGGVIGNTIGNLLIPVILYFTALAWKEKSSVIFALAVFCGLGLFYTHHLSAFIFIFVAVFSAIIYLIANWKKISSLAKTWLKILISPAVLAVIALGLIFVLHIYTPSYIQTNAVETAVGGPSKSTRAGLDWTQLKSVAGEARILFGVLGMLLILGLKRIKNFGPVVMVGWSLSILVMAAKPQWLYLDIPSGRIANYIAYPLAILAAFFLVWLFKKTTSAVFFLIILFTLGTGLYDNSFSLKDPDQKGKVQTQETFSASRYLSERAGAQDSIVKDHNYLMSDAWIKLFFMRDYNFPFSRSNFGRYEDPTKPREMCTLWMISQPETAEAQSCFQGTNTKFVIVNKTIDSEQFSKNSDFDLVFSGQSVNIYLLVADER